MLSKSLFALILAAAVCVLPLAAQAHEGHAHPPAKAKKVKKTKAPKTAGGEFRFVGRPVAT